MQRFFEFLSSEFNKYEIQALTMYADISKITSLIKKYKAPGFSCSYTMSKLINLIAQVEEKRAITLISQLPETDIPGLYGLDIMGIPLRFINTKLCINECIIDHLSMHYDDYIDFRGNFYMTYCTINTLDISLKLNQWQSKVLKEREIREMLNNACIAVDNLNIKFV